jgi:hypothetical protein
VNRAAGVMLAEVGQTAARHPSGSALTATEFAG